MVLSVRPVFKVSLVIVVLLLDATDSSNSQHLLILAHLNNSTCSQEVNILSNPASIVQISQVIRSLMVPSNKDCEYRRSLLFLIELMELTNFFVLHGALQCLQVTLVSQTLLALLIINLYHYLEVSTTKD
jgi:hypothetical protein